MSSDKRRVLYLSRDGILDGLGESQILAYLRVLAADHAFWLLTFEKATAPSPAVRAELAAAGIEWMPFRFHGQGRPIRAVLGLLGCVGLAAWLVLTRRIRIIHARSYVPCALATAVRWLCLGYPRVLFDTRGLWVDERAEVHGWDRAGAAYRLGKAAERFLLHRASGVVTLTERARAEVSALAGVRWSAMAVIPTCVDVERFRPVADAALPAALSPDWRERLAFVYTGAAGFWQSPESLADFFAAVRQERADAVFVCLVRVGADAMRRALARAGLEGASHVEEAVPPADLPRWYRIASFGVVWYRPGFSRIGTFPTKLAEYLACGLPVIVAGATADSVELVTRERVGVVVRDFSRQAYREAVTEALSLAKAGDLAARCRGVAERHLAVTVGAQRYRAVYRRLGGERSGTVSPTGEGAS